MSETPIGATGSGPTAARAPVTAWRAVARIFPLALGQMLWSRRTAFMSLVVVVPVVVALGVRLIDATGTMEVGGRPVNGAFLFGLMVWVFFVRFAVPVFGVFYGTALIADEVEGQTITYLFVRPVPRGAVLVGKYLAYLVCAVVIVLPAVALAWLLVAPVGPGTLGDTFPDFLRDLGLIALGLAVYGAVSSWLGAVLSRPTLVGLLFVFGWEVLVMVLPGEVRRLSVAFYLEGLVPHALPGGRLGDVFRSIMASPASVGESLVWLAAILALSLWLGARAVARREYVLAQ